MPKKNKKSRDSASSNINDNAASSSIDMMDEQFSPIKSPVKILQTQGNLTGSARKMKDGVADWHNVIQKWGSLNKQCMELINQIAEKKLEVLNEGQSNDVERLDVAATSQTSPPVCIEHICQQLTVLLEHMEKVVTKMSGIVHLFHGVQKLQSYRHSQATRADDSTYDDDDDGILFQTWSLDDFVSASEQLCSMYKKEFEVKTVIVQTVAHVNKDTLMLYLSTWVHEPYIDYRSQTSLLESMLIETGHKRLGDT